MAVTQHQGHGGIGLVTTTAQEDEGEERIEHRADDDGEYQPGHTSGRAVHVRIASLSGSPESFAAAMKPQGPPKGSRMRATVGLLAPLNSYRCPSDVHAVVPLPEVS